MITQVMPSVAAGVEIDLADTKYVVGVSYSPKRRMWRAYLHVGKKQVFHLWCDSKGEAVRARSRAAEQYALSVSKQANGTPFERSVKPPKYRDLDKILATTEKAALAVCSSARRIMNYGLVEKRRRTQVLNGVNLAVSFGAVIALAELLVLDGAVRAVDIEVGMKDMVIKLKEGY
jgi:hypothetical protein